mgnify:CR=1 FL=1
MEIPQNIKELFTKDNSIDIDLCEETEIVIDDRFYEKKESEIMVMLMILRL